MKRLQLTEAIAELTIAATEHESVLELLHRLADVSRRTLAVDSAGVLLVDSDGTLRYATATDDLARTFEEMQLGLSEGPCLLAGDLERPVDIPDISAAAEQFPRFAPKVADIGVRAVFTFPLATRDQQIGCLNLLRRHVGSLAEDERAAGQLLTDLTTAFLVNRRALEASEELARQLQEALDSRVVIEQAKGMIAQRLGVTVEDAFPLLRMFARRSNLRVQEAARRFVSGEAELPEA
jgi:transcriptional regulator with GAF, ATPase, and Fis domain